MLSDQEFDQWAHRCNLSDQAKSVIEHIRSSPPARRVQSRRQNVRGHFNRSRKMAHTIQYESRTVELPAILLMELDDDVLEIWDQPPSFDTKAIGELMKQAYEARQNDNLSVKHFIALNTASDNQRERLLSAPLSATAYRLIKEVVTASEKKLGYLGWAMYGDNDPSHLIHTLSSQEQTRIWEVITARKATFMLPRLYARFCSTCGRALAPAWFIFSVALKALLELPRLRKALNAVRNKRRASTRKSFSASMAAVPTHGASAVKKGAAAKLRAEAAHGGRQ